MRVRPFAVLVALAVAALVSTAVAAVDPSLRSSSVKYRIDWDADGNVTRIGQITGLTKRTWTGADLRRRLGAPSRTSQPTRESCRWVWSKLSLHVTLSHFGGEMSCEEHILQLAAVKGKGSSRWHTEDGLYVGDSQDKLQQLYPDAARERVYGELVWVLQRAATPYGSVSTTPTVWAKTRKERVVKLGAWVGGAGD